MNQSFKKLHKSRIKDFQEFIKPVQHTNARYFKKYFIWNTYLKSLNITAVYQLFILLEAEKTEKTPLEFIFSVNKIGGTKTIQKRYQKIKYGWLGNIVV